MRIDFVQLPHPAYIDRNLPLAPAILKASLTQLGFIDDHDMVLVNSRRFDRMGHQGQLNYIFWERPDIICFSIYLWNVTQSLAMIREIKRSCPQIIVVAGGPEIHPVSSVFNEDMEIDYVVHGEGEQPLKWLVQALSDPSLGLEEIFGIGFRKNGIWTFTPPSPHGCTLADTPSPLLLNYFNLDDHSEFMMFTMRGCMSGCSYCSWSARGRLRAYEMDRLYEELTYLHNWAKHAGQRKIVSICDSAFNTSPVFREFCDAICDVNQDELLDFRCFVQADLIDEDAAKLIKKAHFQSVEVGLQSIHSDVLKHVNRPDRLKAFMNGISVLRRYEVPLIVDTILGLPEDTVDKFRQTIAFVTDHGFDPIVFNLSLTSGSKLQRKKEAFGLVPQSTPPYYIVQSQTFSRDDLLQTMQDYRIYSADLRKMKNLGLPIMGNTFSADMGKAFTPNLDTLRCYGPVTGLVIDLDHGEIPTDDAALAEMIGHTLCANPKISIHTREPGIARERLVKATDFLLKIASFNRFSTWDIFIFSHLHHNRQMDQWLEKLAKGICQCANPFLQSLDFFYGGPAREIRRRSVNMIRIEEDASPSDSPRDSISQHLFTMPYTREDTEKTMADKIEKMAHDTLLVTVDSDRSSQKISEIMAVFKRAMADGKQIFFQDWVLQRWWEQDVLKIKPIRQERCEVAVTGAGVEGRCFAEADLYWDSISRLKLINTVMDEDLLQRTIIEKAMLRITTATTH